MQPRPLSLLDAIALLNVSAKPNLPAGLRQAFRAGSKHARGYTPSPRAAKHLRREAKAKRKQAAADRALTRKKFGRNRIH